MSFRRLSLEERKWLLFNFVKHGYSFIIGNWSTNFSSEVPSKRTLFRYQQKLKTDGFSVADKKRSGRPRTAQTEANSLIVCQQVIEHSKTSTCRLEAELEISRFSIRRILKDNNFKPFTQRKVYQLLPLDNQDRLDFCSELFRRYDNDNSFFDNILWSDEAIFKLAGFENRHNTVYWSINNPHAVEVKQLNQPGLMVWAAISSQGVIGPYFFDNFVNEQTYLHMLTTFAIPQI